MSGAPLPPGLPNSVGGGIAAGSYVRDNVNKATEGLTGKKVPTLEERTMQTYIQNNPGQGPPSEFGFGLRIIGKAIGVY